MAKLPEDKVLRTVFFGYQASGKTTFLAAALLDAQQPRQGPKLNIVTDRPNGNNNRHLEARKSELASGSPVNKTEYAEGVLNYDLILRLPGKSPIRIHTVDFPGEVTGDDDIDDPKKKGTWEALDAQLRKADCLFVFFDAELRHRRGMSQELRDRYAGQVKATARAARIYSKAKPNNPVTVVVTKADLIDEDKSVPEAAPRLQILNSQPAKAVKLFKSLFGEEAEIALGSPQRPSYVRFIASLGAHPQRRELPDGRTIYNLQNLDDWRPLGLQETLKGPLERAWKIQAGKTTGQRLRRFSGVIISCAALMMILTVWLFWDLTTASRLEELFLTYERDNVPVEQVYAAAQSADAPLHPFLQLPGRFKTVLGWTLPEFGPSKEVRAIKAELEHRVLAKRLAFLTATQGEIFKEEYNDLTSAESAIDSGMKSCLELLDDVLRRRGELRGAERTRVVNELEEPLTRAIAVYVEDSIDLIWKVATRNSLDVATVEPLSKTYLQQFEGLLGRVEPQNFVLSALEELRQSHATGRCEVLVERYRIASLKTTSDYQGLFSTLSDLCLKCSDAPQGDAVCQELPKRARLWDYYEAKAIYDALASDWSSRLPTKEIYDLMKSYLEHSRSRRATANRYSGMYERTAEAFMGWHRSLSSGYEVTSVNLSFAQSLEFGFLTTEKEARTRQAGYSKETYYVDVPSPPLGYLEIRATEVLGTAGYPEGWRTSASSPISFSWSPGTAIKIRIYNSKSGESLEREFPGFYNLYQLREGVSVSGVSMTFEGLTLPPIRPPRLPTVVPPAELR